MKIKNMPERVTKRRAEAYKRKFGQYPDNYSYSITDTKMRLDSKARMKAPLKFMVFGATTPSSGYYSDSIDP